MQQQMPNNLKMQKYEKLQINYNSTEIHVQMLSYHLVENMKMQWKNTFH